MAQRAIALLVLALIAFNMHNPALSAPSVLRRGATGAEVRQLQRLLNQWLSANPRVRIEPLAVDGIFGPLTERTVRVYQQVMGLPVDGIVGPRTWSYLLRQPVPRSPTPVRTVRPPTSTRTSIAPSSTPSPIASPGECSGIALPTNIAATDPNPLCLRRDDAIQLYLKGFAPGQQYRYYIATPRNAMRGRPRIGHIGSGPLGNGLVVLASGTEFGITLEPDDYILVVEGLPDARPRATAPFRILP